MKRLGIALAVLALMAPSAMACKDGQGCSPEKMKNCSTDKMKACMSDASASAACNMGAKQETCRVSMNFDIKGMTCASCVKKVTKELNGVKGVEAVNVDLKAGKATVDYCSQEIKDTSLLIKAIKKAGYESKAAAKVSSAK